MSVFLIGEAGSTHDGDLQRAFKLIEFAAQAGCDAAKFQFWSDGRALAARRHADQYAEVYLRYAVPESWLELLAKKCQEAHIEFMATAYMSQDLVVLAPYVSRFKVASFEAADREFLVEHNRFPQPVILSTGMMTEDEMWHSTVPVRNLWAVLHCCSSYPAPLDQINLGVIHRLQRQCRPALAGFSDHTRYVMTGGLAVAAGAEVLEVHFMLGDTLADNPDYGHSLTPRKLKEYVGFARVAATIVGDGTKRLMEAEKPMAQYRV